MNFIGLGKRLSSNDIGDSARLIDIETSALLAFLEVEAAGKGFDNLNRPKMLFEPHVFWRELGESLQRTHAKSLGLAYKVWGTHPYPKDSYPRIEAATKINETKALRSASWGLSQMLGDKAFICGFKSEKEFVQAMMQGEREQLVATVTLMKAWFIPQMLQGKDLTLADSWRSAASKWNGTGYAKNEYHIKLAKAYIKHKFGEPKMLPANSDTILINGMKGEYVLALQKDLASLGYVFSSGVDGRFGPETERNVKDFQMKSNIIPDGKAGFSTKLALKNAVKANTNDMSPKPPVWQGQKPKRMNPIIGIFIMIGIIAIGGVLKIFNIV